MSSSNVIGDQMTNPMWPNNYAYYFLTTNGPILFFTVPQDTFNVANMASI